MPCSQDRPAVLRLTVLNRPSSGYGQITYTNRTVEPDDAFAGGARGPIKFAPNPALTLNYLNAPFRDHAFWVADRIVPRAMGDLYDVQINLIVVSQYAGGQVRVDGDVGSSFGPIASDTQSLLEAAGVQERLTFRLRMQVLDNFMANGCGLFLKSNVALTTVSETVLIAPASTYLGDEQ